jgi:hypothetical protein
MTRLSFVMVVIPLAALLGRADVAHAAWPHNPASDIAVCVADSNQLAPVALADGSGGAYVAWTDGRSGPYQGVFWQHLTAAGPLWSPNGVAVVTAPPGGAVALSGMLADGAGGVIVYWARFDAMANQQEFAQRFTAAGVPLWPAGGVAISGVDPFLEFGGVVPDGAGGLICSYSIDYGFITSNYNLFVQHVDGSGISQWGTNGLSVCALSGNQDYSQVVGDGQGGAVVCWLDARVDNSVEADVYAQHVTSAGTFAWPANGQQVTSLGNSGLELSLVSDGAGGAVAMWRYGPYPSPSVYYAQRLSSSGQRLWGFGGLPVSTTTPSPSFGVMLPDPAGGAWIQWTDDRTGSRGLYQQHLDRSGARMLPGDLPIAAGLPLNLQGFWVAPTSASPFTVWGEYSANAGLRAAPLGGLVAESPYFNRVALVSDGANGVIAFWDDGRISGKNYNIYAARVDQWGALGDAGPVITGVTDVPLDQGGAVRVTWLPSYLDTGSPDGRVASYRVWRSVPPQTAAGRALRVAHGLTNDAAEAASSGKLWTGPDAALGYAWELVGSTAAIAPPPPTYSLAVPTALDSVPAANPPTAFLVQAMQSATQAVPSWFSAPDSGYSVDNLAPGAPAPLTGTYAAGTTRLHWPSNAEADLAGYHIYRGTTIGFILGPGNLVASKPDTGFVDVAGVQYVYKVTALDVHGNESSASVFPGATTDAGDAGAAALAFGLEPPAPNPLRSGGTIRFTLPSPGPARLELFDTAGRRVRVLLDGPAEAGVHALRLSVRCDGGAALASGIYLLRLEAAGRAVTQRMAVIQ